MSATKPHWMRIDTSIMENPKVIHAINLGGHSAVTLWINGLSYSTQHLTDGWVPQPLPKRWGYTSRHSKALVTSGLWFEVPITDDGGWLICSYEEYQPTRQEWEAKSEAMRKAANRRWQNRK